MSEENKGKMGFKDKEKALETLQALEERDVSYQYHVITNFVNRAKRTIQITKDQEKLANLREALNIFEDWLKNYKENNRGKENLSYLPLETIKDFQNLCKKYNVWNDDFFLAYKEEHGDYKNLRSVKVPSKETTWDVERNRRLKTLIENIKKNHVQWYVTDAGDCRGFPTKEHAQCITLGYSPEPAKLKKIAVQVKERFGNENNVNTEEEGKKLEKRRKNRDESSSSSEGDSEEPSKKRGKRVEEINGKEEKEENGLSFKDKERAARSIRSLEERDVSYQYHAIAGLIKRAERVISCTKDEQKIKNMKEAVRVFENWITEYKVNGRSNENFDYLPLHVVQSYRVVAERYDITEDRFLKAYEEAEGDYKKLRSTCVPNSTVTWDIERNRNLKKLVNSMRQNQIPWYENNGELQGLPSAEHVRCIMWGFSHDSSKIKKLIPNLHKIK